MLIGIVIGFVLGAVIILGMVWWGGQQSADEGVLVSMVVPGLDPVRPKTFCNGCFETMLSYWERNQIIKPVEVASTGKPRRIDSEGRDVTDLPGLWSETDKDIPQ